MVNGHSSSAWIITIFIAVCHVAGTAGQMRWCYLSDNPNWRWISNDPSQTFAVECTEACMQKEESIWGTGFYTYDSNICRAAVHDGRLSWSPVQEGQPHHQSGTIPSSRVVHLQRDSAQTQYMGSVRFGISSESYGELHYNFGSFRFTNPRITEDVLDITTLSRPAVYNSRDAVTIECHGRSKAVGLELSLGVYANTYYSPHFDDFVRLPDEAHTDIVAHSPHRTWFELALPAEVDAKRTGAFYCTYHDAMLSRVVALAMRTDAYFLPDAITRTVSVGDIRVRLQVRTQFTMAGNPAVSWRKDGEQLSTTELHLTLTSAKLGHAGVYSVLYRAPDARVDRRALFRLIVRVCPDGVYGATCERRCPICLNGGLCHDITGECICPPGFRGPACQIACGPNRFGRDCSAWCSETDSANGCEGALLCLPDPFGCSCAAGFMDLHCKKQCSEGSYGAGCTQKCGYCTEGSVCDRFTGLCPKGCKLGWKGPRCAMTLPCLGSAPALLEATSSSLTIAWSAWDPATDPGDGQADAYILQYRERAAAGEWQEIPLSSHVPHGTFNYTLGSLRPETDYQLRVLILDKSGTIAKDAAPDANYSTVCEGPTQPPPNISFDSSQPHHLLVTWVVPNTTTWRCKEVTYTIRYHNNYDETVRRVTDLTDTRFVIESTPFTEWTLQLRTENLAGASNWSAERTGRTGQDAPGPVMGMQATVDSAHAVFVLWEDPLDLNGILTQFEIGATLRERKACSSPDDATVSGVVLHKEYVSMANTSKHTVLLVGLEPFCEYLISVRAWTIVPGPFVSDVIATMQSVPVAEPVNIRHWYHYETELGFMWNAPPCQHNHGLLMAYLCVLEGADPWVKNWEQRYIIEHKHSKVSGNITADGMIRIKFLKPFTTYRFRVFAGTSAGFSNFSANVTARTDPDVPPPPKNLTVYAKSWTSMSLVWSAPYPPHGEPDAFMVHLDPCPGSGTACNVTVRAIDAPCPHPTRRGQFCFTWDGLATNSTYSAWVMVKNKGVNGFSDPSDAVAVETVESIPGPPSFLQFRNMGSTSLIVTWGQPLITEGAITHYRVNLSSLEPSGTGKNAARLLQTSEVVPGSLEYVFKGLQIDSHYKVSVEACTSAGYGDSISMEVHMQYPPQKAAGGLNSDISDQQFNNPGNHHGYKDDRKDEANTNQPSDTQDTMSVSDYDIFLAGIVGTAVSIIVLLILVVIVLYIIKRKSRHRLNDEDAAICRSESMTNMMTRECLCELPNSHATPSSNCDYDVPTRIKESIM